MDDRTGSLPAALARWGRRPVTRTDAIVAALAYPLAVAFWRAVM